MTKTEILTLCDDELRVQIAEAMLWKQVHRSPFDDVLIGIMPGEKHYIELPHWTDETSLAWQLEEQLGTDHERMRYAMALRSIVYCSVGMLEFALLHASPVDRCRAFLIIMDEKDGVG